MLLVLEPVAECLLLLILTEHPGAQSIQYDRLEQSRCTVPMIP